MKKIFNIVSIMALALTSASCQDWLDMPSESKADNSSVFSSAALAEMTTVGCYANSFNRELYYQLGMGTDECISTEGTTNSKNQVANYLYTTSNIPNSTYTSMYKSIEYANVCIKNLPSVPATSESDKKRIDMLMGEALAVRAMDYLNIVRYFGDVPYSSVPVADLTTFSSSRVSRDTIYDHCIADLQKAVELLPWKSENMVSTPERFTKNSAYGMLARVALFAAGYSLRWDLNTVPYDKSTVKIARRSDSNRVKELYLIAANACKAVIDKNENGLLDDYSTVFRDLMNGQYNKETMLEYSQWGTESNGASTGYTNGIYSHTNSITAKSQPAMLAIPTYYFEFAKGDTRRDVTIANYGIDASSNMKLTTYRDNFIGKFRVDWKSEIGTSANKRDINWPVLRYSDVLLMYAEALNEVNQGPTAEAINALKLVQKRAYDGVTANMPAIPTTHDEFLNTIIKERKLELGFESWRRTDLARWGILYETLTNEKAKLYQLAMQQGQYANIVRYAAYKDVPVVFKNPLAAVSYIALNDNELTDKEKETLLSAKPSLDKTFYEDKKGNVYKDSESVPEGTEVTEVKYHVLDFLGGNALHNTDKLYGGTGAWMTTDLFRGLEKNKVEILPLNTTSMIDINPGLEYQQHPCY